MSTLAPQDHAEAIALFRREIVGALTRRELDRGDLAQALSELSQQRFRPPLAKSTKTYSVATLERWFYAYKSGGLEALRPSPRSDRGRCRDLTAEQRKLLAAIREEHPSASVPVILRTLVAEGRLDKDAISASSVRRFYQEHSLDRVSLRSGHATRGKVRLRWQAERPGALWHADVCHATALIIDGKSQPVRIHGILDDASRYILAIAAHHTEREVDMLGLMVQEEFNQERPHEGIDDETPASRYTPSVREFPRRLGSIEYPAHFTVRKVAASGRIRWKSALVTIGHALEGESIGIEERDGMHHVFFADVRLGFLMTKGRSSDSFVHLWCAEPG